MGKPLHVLEQAVKVPLYDCRDCGDCSLPDIAYLCPESHCQKNQRNGPCGGAHDGDVRGPGPHLRLGRRVPAAQALRRGAHDAGPARRSIQDNDLRRTSAWGNTFLGRDHFATGGKAASRRPRPPAARQARTPAPPRPPARERTHGMRPDRTGTPVPRRRREHPRHPVLKRTGKHAADSPDGSVGHRVRGPGRAPPGPAGPPGPRRRRATSARARSSTSRARSAGASRAATRRRDGRRLHPGRSPPARSGPARTGWTSTRTRSPPTPRPAPGPWPGWSRRSRRRRACRCRSTPPTSPSSRRASPPPPSPRAGCCSTPRRSSAPRSWSSPPPPAARSSSRRASPGGMPANAEERVANADRARRGGARPGDPGGPPVRGPARAAGRGRAGGPGVRPGGGPPAPRGVRRRDPPDRRPVQRLVRDAGAAPAQRHVHRPRGRGRHRQRDHRPGGVGPRAASSAPTATASRTGWRRTCCWAATRSAASTCPHSAKGAWPARRR